ncbi:hypothetical protein M0R45_020050 [Rubus argutus]|uniref:Thioredoxin-like protein n=1 Tax=Rubus argutus TaxID=59490 RepID=A0AAW1X781_RUBAR
MARNPRVLVQQLLGSGNRNPCAALLRKLPGCKFIKPVTTPSSPPPQIASTYRPFSSSIYAPHVHYQRLSSSVPIDSLIRLRAFTASYRNEYESTVETIRDECLHAVCCFYANQSMHLPLIVQGFVENFPHVKIYHFLVFNLRKDDTYDAAMRMLNVSSMPLFLFFQNGKKVEKLVGDSIALLDKTIKNLYK